MTAVVGCCVPIVVVDTIDFVFYPRERVRKPSCKVAEVFLNVKLCTVSPSFATQHNALHFHSRGKVFAIFVVVNVVDLLVVAFERKLVLFVLSFSHIACAYLVGNLRFYDIANHHCTTNGRRKSVVEYKLQILSGAAVSRLNALMVGELLFYTKTRFNREILFYHLAFFEVESVDDFAKIVEIVERSTTQSVENNAPYANRKFKTEISPPFARNPSRIFVGIAEFALGNILVSPFKRF